ncbi:MAG: sodium:solute symporter family protein [Rickettsiales bacterium]|nr:sodium:solute symporter family protein [Rickettsiales bacterium]
MNIYFLAFIISILAIIYIWISKRSYQKIRTREDYFLMGRKLNFIPLFMTFLATMFGGGILVGIAEEAYYKGWVVMFFPLGVLLGCIVLGLGFGKKLRILNIDTIPHIFYAIYDSKMLRCISASFSIIALYFILVAQGIAIQSFFVTIGITNYIYFLLFWLFFVGYTVVGGLRAVIDTDVIQIIFVFIGLILILFSLKIEQITAVFSVSDSFNISKISWTSWLLMPLCSILMGQDMGQRCLAAKNSRIIAPSVILAGVLVVCGAVLAIIFGMLARFLQVDVVSGTNILFFSVQALTSPIITNIFIAIVFMAIMSTSDSVLCAISSNICSDFPIMNAMKTKDQLNLSRVITFCVGMSALICISLFDSVVNALIFSSELYASALFVPIFMNVMFSSYSKNAVIASIIVGAFSFIILNIFFIDYPTAVITLILSFTVYVSVRFFSLR